METCHPLRVKYPDRIPVIVDVDKRIELKRGGKTKFLVPEDITFGQFIYILRNMCYISPEQSIFVFVNNKIPPISKSMMEIYNKNKNKEDHTLYLHISIENTFGFAYTISLL